MARDEQFLQLAIDAAFRSKSKFRLGAVLVKKNRVLSFGVNNMKKTHPACARPGVRPEFSTGLHAEVDATVGVSKGDLERSKLYVARILKNGKPAMAKPCEGCTRHLRELGIREVIYTVSGDLSERYNFLSS